MGWELIGTEAREYTPAQIATIVNNDRNTNFSDLATAISLLGVTVVGTSLFNQYVTNVRLGIQHILGAVGIVASLVAIANNLQENKDLNALAGPLNMAAATGGTVTITTKTYQWVSGSGNQYTWKTETTYKYNKY